MTIQIVNPRTERRHDLHQRRHQPAQPQVISGAKFRRMLCWGKDRFSAAARSGRFDHLVSVHASSRTRTVYVLAKVEQWIAETLDSASPRQSRAVR